jgi:histidinol-phosphate aminotransferase
MKTKQGYSLCVAASVAEIADSFFRPAVQGLVPYEPGKPVEEVQRELGLARCVKLASNEGPFGPFPAAVEALERSVADLNRYPDGGAWRLRTALAERLGVSFDEVAVGSGADGLIDLLSQASLDPGDELVCGWPSFATYPIDAAKLGAVAVKVPLRGDRYDLDAMVEAVTPRTRLVFVCHPNNPTGTMNTRAELDVFLDRVPGHVLVVIDQAYREYVDDPDYPDAIEEYYRAGRPVAVLRTFSKIYGLAGLRVGYLVAPPAVVTAANKVKRAFDVSSAAQAAALASLDGVDEIARRRRLNAESRDQLRGILEAAGLSPAGPAVGNFLYAETGADTRPLFEALLAEGVIVRPLHGFGAPTAIRVSCGTPDENAYFAEALGRVRPGASAR